MFQFGPISWLNNLKLTFQFNNKARMLLILCSKYMTKDQRQYCNLSVGVALIV